MMKIGRGRAKRLVLDIGTHAIRVCELSQTKTGYQLSRYYQREVLLDPLLDDESKRRHINDELKKLLKEQKIRTRKTFIAVPGRSVFTRTRTLPPVQENKVAQIVRYEIQQQIPFALDQISLDFQKLSKTEAGGYDVMMAAIKVDVVEKQLGLLRDTKCAVEVVDICPFATYNWLKYVGEFGDKGECVAMLDIGASTTDIVIERGGQFRFTRPLTLGGNDITAAIRDAMGLNFLDAEKLKRERGSARVGESPRDAELNETIAKVLSRLVTEINRSFSYFRSLPGGGSVDRIVVTGGGACLRNIVPFLQEQFGIEVRIARPLAGLAVAPAAQEINEHPEQAGVALGLALRSLQAVPIAINLVPPTVLEAARRKEQLFYWLLCFVTLGLIGASTIPGLTAKHKVVLERVQTVKKYVQAYDPELAEEPTKRSVYEDKLQAARNEVAARQKQLNLLSNAYTSCNWWTHLLRAVNDARPQGNKIWLSSFESSVVNPGASDPNKKDTVQSSGFPGLGAPSVAASKSGPGAGPGGNAGVAVPRPNGIKLQGYARDPDSLTQFIDQLRQSRIAQGGVFFNEAQVEKVPVTELDDARVGVASSGGQKSQPGAVAGTPDDFVYFFRVDVMFQAAAPQQKPPQQKPQAPQPPPPPKPNT